MSFNSDRIELFFDINMYRVKNSKIKLIYSDVLQSEAQDHAERMFQTGQKEHGLIKDKERNPQLLSRCEIIAWDHVTAHSAFGWWINRSQTHKRAILDNFEMIGIGISHGGIYVCRFC